jgi:hypothetical protein
MDHIRYKELIVDAVFRDLFCFKEYGAKPNILDIKCKGHTTEYISVVDKLFSILNLLELNNSTLWWC